MMPQRGRPTLLALVLVVSALAAACGVAGDDDLADATDVSAAPSAGAAPTSATPVATSVTSSTAAAPSVGGRSPSPPAVTAAPPPTTASAPAATRPAWLGTRVLPLRDDGFGEARATPPELRDRRLVTVDLLTAPETDRFAASVQVLPDDVAARSSWHRDCPVGLDDLRYLTVTFWGFDERLHTGELIVHADAVDDLVAVFRRLHAARFPIEEMRVVGAAELEAPPTGDGNNTTAFECRSTTGATSWSQHAYGLAIDLNPFHNPYVKGDLVLPELASSYADRDDARPGMIHAGDDVTEGFADIGWSWGGDFRTLKDWQHFSRSGR